MPRSVFRVRPTRLLVAARAPESNIAPLCQCAVQLLCGLHGLRMFWGADVLKLNDFGASGRDVRVLNGLRRVGMNRMTGSAEIRLRRKAVEFSCIGYAAALPTRSVTRWQVSSVTDKFRYKGVIPQAYSVHSWTIAGQFESPPWGGRPAWKPSLVADSAICQSLSAGGGRVDGPGRTHHGTGGCQADSP